MKPAIIQAYGLVSKVVFMWLVVSFSYVVRVWFFINGLLGINPLALGF